MSVAPPGRRHRVCDQCALTGALVGAALGLLFLFGLIWWYGLPGCRPSERPAMRVEVSR